LVRKGGSKNSLNGMKLYRGGKAQGVKKELGKQK